MVKPANYSPEHKLKEEIPEAWEGDVFFMVCEYMRDVLKDYGDQGKVATKLVDIIEGVVS